MKSLAFFVVAVVGGKCAAALSFGNLSPINLFADKQSPQQRSSSSTEYPNIGFNFDLSSRSEHVAKEGPLFVVAFDVDETLLQCDYRRQLRCVAHPFSMVLVNYLQSLVAMPTSRLYSIIGLTNGLETSSKFASAGLPGVNYFFRTLYERPFVHFYNPLTQLKDLTALSKQLAHDDPDYAKVAERTVIILIDDLGNTHEVFNRCHKGHTQHVGLNVAAFAPFSSSRKKTPNGCPFDWSKFNLSLVASFFSTYLSDVELQQQAILSNNAPVQSPSAAAVKAAELFRLHASVAGVGRTDITSSMYSQRKFADQNGHVDPLIICPHEKLEPTIGGDSPVYAVLMLDARWMFKYIKSRVNSDFTSDGYTAIKDAVQELVAAFKYIEPLVTDIVIKCYGIELSLENNAVFNCEEFASTLRTEWQAESLEGDPPMLRPDPFLFTFEHMYLNRIGARQYNILSVVLEALAMPEDRTVLLVMDAVTPAENTGADSQAIQDLFKPQAGFFKSGPSGMRFHNQKNRRMREHLEYQFVLEKGVGDKLLNLRTFFKRLAATLSGSALPAVDVRTAAPHNRSADNGDAAYSYELEQRLSRHLINRNRQLAGTRGDCDDDGPCMAREDQLYEKLIDLAERVRSKFGAALVFEADEIAIPFFAVA